MPIYYVMFTTATITASVILFQGFNTTSTVDVVSLFCGFGTIFSGVLLLNNSNPQGVEPHGKNGAITGGPGGHGYADRRVSRESAMLHAFDEESLGLTQLRETEDDESDEEEDDETSEEYTEDEDRHPRVIIGRH